MRTEFSAEQLRDPATAASEAVIRKCVHCGFCTATCPTYVLLGDELDSPRGRIYLIKDMLENDRTPSAEVVRHVDRCLSCLACMTTCPSGVNYMHLVDHARAYIAERYRRPLLDRAFRALLAAVLPNPRRFRIALAFARLVQPAAPLVDRVPALRPLAAMLKLAGRRTSASSLNAPFGLSLSKPFFSVHAREPDKKEEGLRQAQPERGTAIEPIDSSLSRAPRRRLVLLQGCAEPVLRPEIRAATLRLLDRAGYDVVPVQDEVCCGALVHHMGREAASLAAARRNIDAWTRERDRQGLDAIVVTTSGCGTTIKDYGFMLRDDPGYAAKAAAISALAMDVSELLAKGELPPGDGRGLTIAYHAACSLQHGQKITDLPKRLLERAGYVVRSPAEAHLCCGSAGTYNILQPVIAGQLGDRKAAQIARLGCDVIATGNIGCAVQIGARTATPVVHTVELLDWASGGPVPPALATLDLPRRPT